MINFYKIKHNPTGLFYKPVRGLDKRNLSKKGKAYNQRPGSTLKHIMSCGYCHPEDVKNRRYYSPPPNRHPEEGEFEIIEYKVIEE